MVAPSLSVDELIAYLKKTDIPTVLVEGTCDAKVYRHIETLVGKRKDSFLPCGGRTILLDLFKRRREFDHVPLVFIADRDTWYFSETPLEYSGIIWTTGYSIENDVICGSRIEAMMTGDGEREHYHTLLMLICEWFAFEIEEFLAGRESHCGTSLGKVLNEERTGLRPEFLAGRTFRAPANDLREKICQSSQIALRGRTLLSLLAIILSAPTRRPKHSKEGILEICLTHDRNPDLLLPIAKAVQQGLEPQLSMIRD